MEEVFQDSRFSHIGKDPRFRQIKNKERKVKIDKRFHGMFEDKKFKLKYQVDKRGRPIKATTSENLRKFYDASDSESSEEKTTSTLKKIKTSGENKRKDKADVSSAYLKKETKGESKVDRKRQTSTGVKTSMRIEQLETSSKDSEDDLNGDVQEKSTSDSESELDEEIQIPDITEVDLARGEGDVVSSSDEEEFEFQEEEFDHKWGEIDQDAVSVEEASRRLAICNMDWDRIKAADLMVLLSSFKPAGGIVKSVTIYPSEFGLERMKQENAKGPIELTEKTTSDNTEENDDGTEYHREKLRQYQLNRLKYYYAVAEFDSAKTANSVYEQCDGIEYESSSAKLDLRFIPDDMEFEQTPKDQVTDMPSTTTYKPSLFLNSALQQSNVKLTWDETPHDRVAVTMKKYSQDELEEMDVKDYLASSSGEEEEDEENKTEDVSGSEEGSESIDDGEDDEDAAILKYRNLILDIKGSKRKKENKDVDMEITWEPGLKDTTEGIIKKKEKEKDYQTPWERYLQKKRDKQTKKREDKKSKGKANKEDTSDEEKSGDYIPEGIDMDDPYFKEEIDKLETRDTCMKKKNKNKKGKKKGNLTKSVEEEKEEAEIELLTMDDSDNRKHFSLEKIIDSETISSKKKKKKKKTKSGEQNFRDNFEIDVADSRFNAIYDNPMYNIDPSASQFKQTKAMDKIIEEKANRRKRKADSTIVSRDKTELSDVKPGTSKTKKQKRDIALASLVKSVKTKTKTLQNKRAKTSAL